jgi:hypothetical protein
MIQSLPIQFREKSQGNLIASHFLHGDVREESIAGLS